MRPVIGNDAVATGQGTPTSTGKVYLVGAGPGDPELLTLKALRVLKEAEVVLHDRLISPEILSMVNPSALRIDVGKRPGSSAHSQDRINSTMLGYAASGRTVARLKSGDPLIFGRGGEEWGYLRRHDIEVEMVPGITSAVSVPGVVGIPLTLRGVAESFAVITGQKENGSMPEWSRYAQIDTLVILMGVHRRGAIARALIVAGRSPDEPAAFVERGTTGDERVLVTNLAEIAAERLAVRAPAVLVVGQVVDLHVALASRARLSPPGQHLRAVDQAAFPLVDDHHPAGDAFRAASKSRSQEGEQIGVAVFQESSMRSVT
ncbi:MAG: uroporphyrinogen-III C-methyltransferase [Gammaproteobacteria bacterium]|nr:uroporphyrinogen-III C-methyltransferase [Gammaproteobacteria bacterium]